MSVLPPLIKDTYKLTLCNYLCYNVAHENKIL